LHDSVVGLKTPGMDDADRCTYPAGHHDAYVHIIGFLTAPGTPGQLKKMRAAVLSARLAGYLIPDLLRPHLPENVGGDYLGEPDF
jgi:hypothetical protein